MKIGFISDALYPWNVGGLEALESTESKELAKTHEVHFFSLRWPGMEKDFTMHNIRYHTLHDITTERFYRHGRRSIRESVFYAVGLCRIFFYKFDYIQSNEFPILHLPILKVYCKLTGCKLILHMFEVWDKEYWTSYLGKTPGAFADTFAKWAIRGADAYISISSVTADKLENYFGIEKEKIHVFAPVLDDKDFEDLKKEKETNRVMFSGRLIKDKAINKMIRAIGVAKKKVKNIKGLVLGKGPEKESLEKLINELKLKDTIELRDFYESKKTLYEKLKSSKLLLQMSEREGLSIIVLESLKVGTPVVVPDYSPIPKEVKDMCIIKPEMEIPDTIAEIMRAKDKRKYLKDLEGLKTFSASNTNAFYTNLFRKLGEKG